jgi:hypothetical protein
MTNDGTDYQEKTHHKKICLCNINSTCYFFDALGTENFTKAHLPRRPINFLRNVFLPFSFPPSYNSKKMNKTENIITLTVLIGLVALVFFIYNWFDSNILDYRALVASIISLSIAGYYLTRGKFRGKHN